MIDRSQNAPKIRQIFLDLDDVLNTLAPHMMRIMGCKNAPDDYSACPSEFGFATHDIVNERLGTEYTWSSFWNNIPLSAWVSVPETPFAELLLMTSTMLVGKRNVYIATAPTDSPHCAAGKMEWLYNHLPSWMCRQFIITPCKYLVANHESLLIDDNEENIRCFKVRGGSTITVPRPWNAYRDRDPEEHIMKSLEHFQYERFPNADSCPPW